MKLLSWIRTIKQNGSDHSKEFKDKFCCLRADVSSEVQDIRTNSFSFSRPISHDMKRPEADEELWFDHEDGFSGFLSIGTLGREAETPRFTSSLAEEDVTQLQKEIAKLITEKLAKFPEDSSSNLVKRSNAEGDRESVDVRNDLYLSSIEITKRSKDVKKKKALLTSLFKTRKTVEGECNSMEKHGTRVLIRRVLEKLHMSCSSKRTNDSDDVYMAKKKDLRKNVQIFRRKVHPLLCTPARDDKEIESSTNRSNLKTSHTFSSSISEANMKREKWIKTDAEYLVLEL